MKAWTNKEIATTLWAGKKDSQSEIVGVCSFFSSETLRRAYNF